jgi:hypothetical protein
MRGIIDKLPAPARPFEDEGDAEVAATWCQHRNSAAAR